MRPIWNPVDGLEISHLSADEKVWITRAVIGAVVADGVISPGERPHLASLYRLVKGEPQLENLVADALLKRQPIELSPLKLEPQLAVRLYQVTLDVCASDLELHPHEITYLLKLADLLSIAPFEARRLLKFTLQMMRIEYLLKMRPLLGLPERAWLATAIVRLVWADGVVEARETEFLSHLFHLIEDAPELLEQMRNSPASLSFEALAAPHFGEEFSERLLQYLIEMTIEGNRLEPFGLDVVREAGVQLGRSKQHIEELIDQTREFLAL
ncbi:MAG: hypothetical protein RRB13_15945 [bacterium]|nr:hypothetical protein [bacterium]